jgi:recombination protein RecT
MKEQKDALTVIKHSIVNSPVLKSILGEELEKYGTNIVAEIAKTKGDEKKDLTVCSPSSIVSAIKQACDLKLTVDGRQHCYLIKYGQNVQLQIGYRGFVYSVKKAYADANIDVQLVYKGDDFKLVKEGDVTNYSLTRNNPFGAQADIIGGFCYISYTLGNRLVSFCETMSLQEINKIKGCAKQDFIWKAWFEEKAKVAILKRACKIHFTGINENLEQLADFDNQDYDLSKEVKEIEVNGSETIDSEQAFEIEELLKKCGKTMSDFLKIFKIDSILQLPSNKFESAKKTLINLGGGNDNS